MNVILEELAKSGRKDIAVTTSGCAGLCSKEPMMTIELSGEPPVRYIALTEEKARKIFAEHVVAGNPVKDYALVVGHETTY
jgi:NADP-reducing hydrogenase subunit HndB